MANNNGLDFDRIRAALGHDYPRAADMPGAGFAAGPCLFKDTMQLAAFSDNSFVLGHAAMLVNEGLPLYVVSQLEKKLDLENLRVGILGMAFKGESDDIRSSLSYKLKRILRVPGRRGAVHRPYVTVDDTPAARSRRSLARADVLVIGAPHQAYRDLRRRRPGRGRVEPARQGHDRMTRRRLGRHPRLQRGRGRSSRFSTGSSTPWSPTCQVLVVVDFPEDTTVPVVEKYADARAAAADRWSTPTGAGPANAIRYGIDQVTTPVVVVTMADGSDDPRQIDQLARLVDRGVVVAAASRYSAGGQQVGGPLLKGCCPGRPAARWASSAASAPATPPTASRPTPPTFVREVGIHSRSGFEIGLELTAKARRLRRPVAEVPTIWLDRTIGESNFDLEEVDARSTCAGTASRSARQLTLEQVTATRRRGSPRLNDPPTSRQRITTRVTDMLTAEGPGLRLGRVHRRATSSRSCCAAATPVRGIDNYSKYGPVEKSYDSHPDYDFVEDDARNVDLMTKLLSDCDHFIAGAALIGGISYFHAYAYDLLATNERIMAVQCDAAIEAHRSTASCKKVTYLSSSMVFESTEHWPSEGGRRAQDPAAAVVVRLPEAGRRVLRQGRLGPVPAALHDRAAVQLRRHRRGPGAR